MLRKNVALIATQTTQSHFYDDLAELSNFYNFSNRNNCFKRGKNIDVRTLKFGAFKIKVNLINSAPFSLLGSDNGDKGLHYFPMGDFSKFDFDKYNLNDPFVVVNDN